MGVNMTQTSSNHSTAWIFRFLAVGFALAAAYHLTALLVPAFAKIAYSVDYPAWRHIAFIFIDGTFAFLFVARPNWLIWPYILLTLQVINGHGRVAWLLWREQRQIDWISVVVAAGVIVGLAAMCAEYCRKAALKRAKSAV